MLFSPFIFSFPASGLATVQTHYDSVCPLLSSFAQTQMKEM